MNQREDNPFEDEIIAQEWINSVENEKGRTRELETYPRLTAWAQVSEGKTILEIGSGQGICADKVQPPATFYIGIEPSVPLVRRSEEIYPHENRTFVVGNAYDLPLEDESVDAAFSVNVWFHLKDLDFASKEMARVIKRGGNYLISTANPESNAIWESFFADFKRDGKLIDGKINIPVNPLTRNTIYQHTLLEIRTALEKAGLTVEREEPFGHPDKPEEIFINITGTKPE
jgi:ubiquinone/menaquinone biosynthesis C-methylase UbiE